MQTRASNQSWAFATVLLGSMVAITTAAAGLSLPPSKLKSCEGSSGDEVALNMGDASACKQRNFENPDDLEALIDLAIFRFEEEQSLLVPNPNLSGRLESLALVGQALEKDPKNARAHVLASDIWTWLGDLKAAIVSLSYAMPSDFVDYKTAVRYAGMLIQLQRYEEVEYFVRVNAADYADDPVLMSIRATALRELFDDAAASEVYDKLIAREVKAAAPYLHRADLAALQGDTSAAIDDYDTALAYSIQGQLNFGIGLGTRGYPGLESVLDQQENTADELPGLCSAFEESPDSARIAMRIASVLGQRAGSDEAAADRYVLALRTAVELATENDADVLAAAGKGLHQQGQYASAAWAYLAAYDYVESGYNSRGLITADTVNGAIGSFLELGISRTATERYIDNPGAAAEAYARIEAETDLTPLQLTFAGPRFEEALSKFYAYWQAVDLRSLELVFGTASPCELPDDRFERVIQDHNVLYGRYSNQYRDDAHRRIRVSLGDFESARLHEAGPMLTLLSTDESSAEMSAEDIVLTIEDVLLSYEVLGTLPLRGVYAVPNLEMSVVNVPYEVPKDDFPGGIDDDFCRTVSLRPIPGSCLIREKKNSYLVWAEGVSLKLQVDSNAGKEQYLGLLDWMKSNRDGWRYTMTAYLGGAEARTSHALDYEYTPTDDDMYEFSHKTGTDALGCDELDISDKLDGGSLQNYVAQYYETMNLVTVDATASETGMGLAIIDYFSGALPGSNVAIIRDKHFEFGAQKQPGRPACLNQPKKRDQEDERGAHGLNVVGVLAAQKNDIGFVGITHNDDIYAFGPTADSGHIITPQTVIDIIGRLSRRGATTRAAVLNGSFEFRTEPDGDLDDQLANSFFANRNSILFVFAAGRKGNKTSFQCTSFPACYGKYPNVLAVAPLTHAPLSRISLRSESDYGNIISLAAPGTGILTTEPGHHYVMQDGSSMAAPFVAGTAFALHRKAPELTAPQLKQRLIATSYFFGRADGHDARNVLGGILDYGRAINNIYQDVVIFDPSKIAGTGLPAELVGKITPLGDFSEFVFYVDSSPHSRGKKECVIDDLLRLNRNAAGRFTTFCVADFDEDDDYDIGASLEVLDDKIMNPMANNGDKGANDCFYAGPNGEANCFIFTEENGTEHKIDLNKIKDIYFGFHQ